MIVLEVCTYPLIPPKALIHSVEYKSTHHMQKLLLSLVEAMRIHFSNGGMVLSFFDKFEAKVDAKER